MIKIDTYSYDTLEFIVACSVCGSDLKVEVNSTHQFYKLEVEPCETCEADAINKGYRDALEEGA